MNQIALALFLAVINESVVEAFVAPAKIKFPKVDFWWVIYVAWVTGGLVSYFAGVNLFVELNTKLPMIEGQVLTAVLVGGGSSLISNVFGRKPKTPVLES